MTDWQPFREPLRVTLTRTVSIALVAGTVVAVSAHALRLWPVITLLMLWPSVGGHWIDLLFLNRIRPHLPQSGLILRLSRIAVWFGGGIVLALGVRLTARLLFHNQTLVWLTWATAGAVFVAVELVAHAALHARGRPSFYNGLG
ncbi:MAG: hypothetical protein ABI625_23680 [bacterium]